MRFATIASAALLAFSTAALAQVGAAVEEQKLPGANAVAPDDTARPEPKPTATPTPTPQPGAPSTALVNSSADESPTPVGQQPPK